MSNYGHPGVYVQERLLSGSPDFDPSVSMAVFVAAHGRGPVEPTTIRSWSEFVRVYGGFPARTSLLPYALFNYFNAGGNVASIIRVLGTGSATSSAELPDGDSVPAPTLDVEAKNPGAWGDDLAVSILDVGADRFELRVHFGGTSNANVVERFTDLSMDPDSQRYAVSVVNSASAGSSYVTVTDLESSNVDDGSGGNDYAVVRPAETASPVALSGGNDGDTPATQDMTDAVDELEKIERTFVVNFPGVSESSVLDAALAACESLGKGFLIVDPSPGANVSEVTGYADTLSASSYGALYYPWLHYRDPASNSPGATRHLPPGGSVAGLMVSTDTKRGVWKAPAGLDTRVLGAVSLELELSSSDLDALHLAHVNPVRHIAQVGITVMGARTLKKADADKYVPIRRTLIHLRQALIERTRWAGFEANDELLWSTLQSRLSQFLTGFWQEGGLKGNTAAEAFFVRVDSSINPPESVAAGEVRVEVGVALRYPAEFVIITLSQWEGGNGQTEELATIG
ncbi:MAG: phage tail sheath subtilisin-like domain-containing protein [Intrasporangiaceae bacterium]|nr:phage tail sheath subtilisin-like domain-containing protein [Intrasporangiaceae bacterium]